MARVRLLFPAAACLSIALTGCERPLPVQPHTCIIPLKVWVVLAPGEQVGNLTNRGCRLGIGDIDEQIRELQSHAFIFGQNVLFEYSLDDPTVVEDLSIQPPPFPRTREVDDWDWWFVGEYGQNCWWPEHVNIYFVGNVEKEGPAVEVAMNTDPRSALQSMSLRAWILMNDCGYEEPSGFSSGYTPADIRRYHVIEHEMTHNLARFDNRWFGQTPYRRFYGFQEHSSRSNNILYVSSLNPVMALVIPGRWTEPGTEQFEIWDRIWDGMWDQP